MVIQDKHAACAKFLRQFGVQPNDLIVLQATRVVRRKNIELAIDFVKILSRLDRVSKLKKLGLFNGHGFDPAVNNIILVIAGYAEKRDEPYLQQILNYAKESHIKFAHLNGRFAGYDRNGKNGEKEPSLLDLYIYADLVTYPSSYEGFGNQLLEAIWSKAPVVIFEYPVFRTDIKDKGFNLISLGSELSLNPKTQLTQVSSSTLTSAVDQAVDLLTDHQKYHQVVQTNFTLGKKHFSFDSTLEKFISILKPGYSHKLKSFLIKSAEIANKPIFLTKPPP